MEIVVKKLADLHEAPKNVRKHTEKQIKEYIRSLKMFGQIKPIIIDENGEIIAGNGLFKALQEMGKETCDCYILSGMTSEQKKKLMLADNRIYELGITDVNVFEEIILELNGDIDVPGWDEDLLSMMNATVSDVDEMIANYGAFGEEEINHLSESRNTSEKLPTVSKDVPAISPVSSQSSIKEMPAAQSQKFIICPNCGERICL